MLKSKPIPIKAKNKWNLPSVLIVCPNNPEHGIEPLPTFKNLWDCDTCGTFEVTDAI